MVFRWGSILDGIIGCFLDCTLDCIDDRFCFFLAEFMQLYAPMLVTGFLPPMFHVLVFTGPKGACKDLFGSRLPQASMSTS